MKGKNPVFFKDFKELFGRDEFFVNVFKAKDLFTVENMVVLQTVTEELDRLDEIPNTVEKLNSLKNAAIRNPIYVNSLVSKDGNT